MFEPATTAQPVSPKTDIAEPRTAEPQHVLDRAVWESLSSTHVGLAQRNGRFARYDPEACPFVAFEDESDPRAWADAAELLGPQPRLTLPGVTAWPDDWKPAWQAEVVQMVGTLVEPLFEPEAVLLGPDDVPEMLDLVARTKPGPFGPRTVELGTYLGIRRDGVLIAMAGERIRPPGWAEVSAVCTDPAYRGQGLGGRMVRAVAATVAERGEKSFLHVMAANTNAIRLYTQLGFEARRTMTFATLERV